MSVQCCSTAVWPRGAAESLFTGRQQLAAPAPSCSVELKPEPDSEEVAGVCFLKKVTENSQVNELSARRVHGD